MTTRCAAILSACLFGLTAQAAAQPAAPAEATVVYQIRFDGACDGFEITVTGNYAAALPTGCAARQGVAVGTIGRPPTGTSRMLTLGQNLNGARNFVAMFLISYPLRNGGTVTLIGTRNGKTIENGGSTKYFMGPAQSTRSSKSFLSPLQRAE